MSQERFVVLSDIDGVLAHSQDLMLERFNRRFATNYSYGDWDTFSLIADEAIRLSKESPEMLETWLFSSKVVASSPTVPGSQEAINKLESIGIRFVVVSSRPASQSEITKEWVKKMFPRTEDVYLRDKSNDVKGGDFKVDMVGRLAAQVYIDDDPSIIEILATQRTKNVLRHLKALILPDRPWNRTYDSNGVIKVGNWQSGDFGWNETIKVINSLRK